MSKRRSKRNKGSRRSDYNVPPIVFDQRPDCHLLVHSTPHYIVVSGELVPCKVTLP